ncbi:dihydropteroate synthase [Pseudoalteromonas phenolica]|uniref:Dihydropteroate synthase n=1 Tax=Pseudoalteromonas phenolica TaxID=161398 RepID=A0A0S2K1A8_9GAMM|nr:dihydropteroate synthase [Pseudoalteromonas phenolica]ALO41855.1 Dihydropteroate synthase [Pseudoalteromonas phenolica]MBE0353585.1 dihydropteroate synthase [Pseudoalteromonas phenolica O-BC30]RXE94146.1 dihydropteroate synthase [Pseudoalteromonas phenolica O-BC30]
MTQLSLPRNRTLDLTKPIIMGIVNVTPDSFSDGGNYNSAEDAFKQAMRLIEEGAEILDIGGESTRPGAPDVALQEELQRVIPVIKRIREASDCVISIDTSKAAVMEAAIEAGADIINDVRALQEPGALEVAAKHSDVPVCLMHMQGQPRTMQANPTYENLISEINQFFEERVLTCSKAGINQNRIILDPGFGFGKTLNHNFEILDKFKEFSTLGLPLLAGLSRKSMFGQLLNRETHERVAASLAGALLCAQKGAHIIRVHDVKETADVIGVWQAARNGVTPL